jgi:hypothetical protein
MLGITVTETATCFVKDSGDVDGLVSRTTYSPGTTHAMWACAG